MKSIEKIKSKIDKTIIKSQSHKHEHGKKQDKLRKKIAKLNACLLYLETNPSEEFIKQSIAKLEEQPYKPETKSQLKVLKYLV